MPIDFFNLLDDDKWKPLSVDQSDPANLWHDGGLLADASVDVKATFKDKLWETTKMDPEFRMRGHRCAPNFTVPRRHHNQHKLIIVFGGEFNIEYENAKGKKASQRIAGPGGFFVVEEETPHTLTAGAEGVTFTEQWDYHPPAKLETTWYDEGWVKR